MQSTSRPGTSGKGTAIYQTFKFRQLGFKIVHDSSRGSSAKFGNGFLVMVIEYGNSQMGRMIPGQDTHFLQRRESLYQRAVLVLSIGKDPV